MDETMTALRADHIECLLRERAVETPDGPMVRMADVETALVLARREGHAFAEVRSGRSRSAAEGEARHFNPLPKRTRQVLREEPEPGRSHPIYRWQGGHLEQSSGDLMWTRCSISSWDTALMRHALDLHDNPYRTVEEPADEDNPWPEVE